VSTLPVTWAEGGAGDTVAVTAANSAAAGSTLFDTVTNPSSILTHSTAQKHAGAQSLRCAQPATAVTTYGVWNGWGTITTDVWFRGYFFVSAVSAVNLMISFRSSADAASSYWGISATGKFIMQNAAGTASITGATTISANTWYRVEGRIVSSTTAGNLEYRLFSGANLDGTTATDAPAAVTNAVLAANTGGVRFTPAGVTSGGPGTSITAYWDDVIFTTAGWPGPATVTAATYVRRSRVQQAARGLAGRGVFPMFGWRRGRCGLAVAERQLLRV
jgi:hypothetical protein